MKRRCLSLALLLTIGIPRSSAWYITAPRTNEDWRDLSRVVADSFEAPDMNDSWLERAKWLTFERELSTMNVYRQFTRNARKLRGKKYAIFLVKEWGEALGVVELGMKLQGGQPCPTIGMICVDSRHRGKGIAKALVQHCETIVSTRWLEKEFFAEVEETNESALRMFESLGFEVCSGGTVAVEVREGFRVQKRDHLRLSKSVDVAPVDESVGSMRESSFGD